MKRILATLALVVFGAAPALADPKSDLIAAMVQFSKTTTYHMTVTGKGREMEADFALPSKLHMTSAQFEMIKIDTTTWVKMGGKWQQFSMPGMDQFTGSISKAIAMAHPTDDIVVTDLGPKSPLTGGAPMHAYSVTNKAGKSPDTLFLDGGRLIEIDNADGTTVRFSKFDEPVDISPPM